MTDDTRDSAGTESPRVEPFGLDTRGPDATPEQDASVTSLLGLLRGDDIAMPDDVVRRLDAVLAEEGRLASARRASGLTGAAALGDADAPSDVAAGTRAAGDGLATVLPIGSAPSRRGRDLGWLTWLGGAAAAVLVVGGGFAVLGHGGSSSVSTASSSIAPEAASGGTAVAPGSTAIRATSTNYSATTLPTQVSALLSTVTEKDTAATAGPLDSPAALGAESTAASAAGQTPGPASTTRQSSGFSSAEQALTTDTVAACMTHLDLAGVVPLVVDRGSFDGKPADVIVVPTKGDPTRVDVYVLHLGCATAEPLVYEFATVPSA